MIQTVHSWLSGYPGLESLKQEHLAAAPGSAGLFCQGQQVLRENTDILGNVVRRVQLRFLLAVHCCEASTPQRLLDLDRWAQQSAPTLGQMQTLRCQKGRLVRADAQGTARYETEIIFEFTEV